MISLDKIEGVIDCVKWLEKKCKEQKKRVEEAEKDYSGYGMHEDCGPSYKRMLIEEETRLKTMVEMKVSLEKYSKKLRHEFDEQDN